LSSFVFAFPVSTGVAPLFPVTGVEASAERNAAIRRAEKAAAVETMLVKHGVDEDRLPRVHQAIMDSSLRHGVDPQLVASIIIVESGANPFAVSEAESVGLMQIHLRTWGSIAEKENLNLFKIEDNVDFGVRILRDYIGASDTWEGVARYRGKTNTPESQQTALDYVRKVQRIYGLTPKT
jgi:soluble lytic murein transglycosylase-like protein